MRTILALVLLCMAISASAQTTFYDEYQTGLAYEHSGAWQEARNHFLQAIQLNHAPARQIEISQGTFLRFYDPYAHAAHCEFQLGLYPQARAHLEISRKAHVIPENRLMELQRRLENFAGLRRTFPQEPVPDTTNTIQQTPAPASTAPKISPSTNKLAKSSAAPKQTTSNATTPSAPKHLLPGRKHLAQIIVALLLIGIVALVVLVRSKKQPTVTPTPVAAINDSTQLNNSPTHDLRFEKRASPPVRTPTPLDSKAVSQIENKAESLPEGTETKLGGYELRGILGKGGMGTTYLARRNRDGLPVALKVPHDHLLDRPEFVQRFVREGSLGSTLHHPNIIRILEAGEVGNKPFIAMELLDGETVEAKLRQYGPFPLQEGLDIIREIGVALDYARLKGIVHRDLKPENIMLLNKGGVKVMDFGIARLMDHPGLTSSEAYLGTPAYSAPEATGGTVDQQSDLYSLGILLYKMLCGELPFRGKNALEMLDMHRTQPLPPFPENFRIPEPVFQLVKKLTEKKKEDRFPNAEIFLIELNRVANLPEINAQP